jgi:hypothetical protein
MAGSSNRQKELFLAALDVPSAHERDAFLAEACGPDEALRRQVEAMLKAHAAPDSFLEKPAAAMALTVAADSPDGQFLAVGQQRGILVVNTSSGIEKLLSKESTQSVAYSTDGKLLAGGGVNGLKIYDAENGELKIALSDSKLDCYAVSFSPDNKYVLAQAQLRLQTVLSCCLPTGGPATPSNRTIPWRTKCSA